MPMLIIYYFSAVLMYCFSRTVGLIVVLALGLLSGCTMTPDSSTPSLPHNPALQDVGGGINTRNVSFVQLESDMHNQSQWYMGSFFASNTFSFDVSVSGEQLDNTIAYMDRYNISYNSNQMQQGTNVVTRSVSVCYLNTTSDAMTRLTDTTGLVYHVKQRGSGYRPLIDSETITFGDLSILALTVKNTTSDLIQFSGGSNCGPISPYGYARWYISRPMISQLLVGYTYKNQSGSVLSSNGGWPDMDRTSYATWSMSSQAFPKGTLVTFAPTTGMISLVSGSLSAVTNSSTTLAINQGVVSLDTSTIATGEYTVTLYDLYGSVYTVPLTIYDRIIVTPTSVDSYFDTKGYYRAYSTQSSALLLDRQATNKLLARSYSGVTLNENIWVSDCTGSCFVLDLKLQSGQSLGPVTVVDAFGITGVVDLQFTMGPIKESLKTAVVRGEDINLLTQGVWDNAIQVDYENIASTKLFYYACQRRPEVDISNQLSQLSYTDNYARLEDLLFTCQTGSVNQDLTSKTNRYRTPQTAQLPVPSQLAKTKAFMVKTAQTGKEAGQLFIQTQIGIYAKQGPTSVTIWLFDLKTGKPIITSASLQLYQLHMNKGRSSSGSISVNHRPYVVSTENRGDMTALTAKVGDAWGFVTLGGRDNQSYFWTQDRGINLQSSIGIGEVTDTRMIQGRGYNSTSRVYVYTDRGLYKPGDELFIAGWMRKLSDIGQINSVTSGTIAITIRPATDWSTVILQSSGVVIDEFGGFNTSFTIPEDIKLDDYMVEVTDPQGATYTQTIKINEYQKPTFYIDQTLGWSGEDYRMTVQPGYYFGGQLQGWTYQTDWSVAPQQWGRWRWDIPTDRDYYYDTRLEYAPSSTLPAATIAGGGVNQPVTATLFNRDQVSNQSATIKVATKVTDRLSDETHVMISYETISPIVSIGLLGQPYERYYEQSIDDMKDIKVITSGDTKRIDRLTYTWYYYDRTKQQLTKGIDGSLYYDGRYYEVVSSGSSTNKSHTISHNVVDKPGDWLLVVQAWDKDNNEIGHNEKSIWYAAGQGYNYGSMNNNYTLTVSIDQKQYDDGDLIPININPYIQGATVLVTVEQGDRIVDSYIKTLDGSQITIPAKKSYYPSAIVSVMQLASSNLTTMANSKLRYEPRMRQGYSQVKINQDLFALTIDIKTDKTTYQPGEEVKLTITTTDDTGRPVDARLSVGVVDKSLNDLYSYFKSPLSDFFLSLGTTLTNYTNMKWIYQGLKVFNQEGSKGGGGGGRNPLGFLRQKFEDVAFWRGGVYTKDGVWTTTFTLPDNLTTWTIDVVGLTQDSKVGTITTDIIATKDLVIQPNLPLYVTIGDELTVPVKVLGITDQVMKLSNKDVVLSGSITTPDGQLISLIRTTTKLNDTAAIQLFIDPKRYQYHDIVVELGGQIGSYHDWSKQTIPLRTNGLTQTIIKTSITDKGSLALQIPTNAVNPQINISIGQMPVLSLGRQLDYLIQYPYGCAEQTASIVSALLAAHGMTQYGLFGDYFSGDQVTPTYGSSFSLTAAVQDAKTRLWKYQQSDGGFGYWEQGQPYYMLSVYIYSIVMKYPQLHQGYEAKLTQLERYLDSNGGASNPDEYLYYIYQKSLYRGGVNITQVKQLIDSDTTARVAPELLGAAIAVQLNDYTLASTWFDQLSLDDFDGAQTEYGSLYPLLTPRSALRIYQQLLPKLAGSKGDAMNQELIVSLIRQRNAQGLWGYSTVDNLAALETLGAYYNAKRKPVHCDITYIDHTQTVTIGTGNDSIPLTLTGQAGQKAVIQWSCDDTIVLDSKTSYLTTSLTDAQLSKKNVEYLQWNMPTDLQVGDMSTAVAQFKITQPAPHTAIELYVPAIYKLSDTINTKQAYTKPFTVEGSWGCQPDHYEVRFDRLFLYYYTLEANQSCRISIPILKAYSGSTVIMPSKLWQMYDDSVYATVIPTFK